MSVNAVLEILIQCLILDADRLYTFEMILTCLDAAMHVADAVLA